MKKILNNIYNLIPFKKEIFSVVKKVWKPKSSVFKHLHFKGVLEIPVGGSRSFKINHHGYQLENELFWEGITNGWEKESSKLWLQLCENSEVIIDVGANTGVYSLIAKAINPDAKVYAFEPVKRVYEKLVQNIALNNYNIVAIEKALSDSNGTAVIYDTAAEHVYSVTVNKNLSSTDTKVIETKIETVTLASFIEKEGLKKIDLLKIDVETHEPEVLEGFGRYLAEFKPTMLIEILYDEVGEKVSKIVEGLGYLYFNIDEKNSVRRVDKITKSDYYNYLLCSEEVAIKLNLISKK